MHCGLTNKGISNLTNLKTVCNKGNTKITTTNSPNCILYDRSDSD